MALYNRRRYAMSRFLNWVSKAIRVERREQVLAIEDVAARKRTVMQWAREAAGGDDKEAWYHRWVTDMHVPEYIARIVVSDEGEAVARQACHWTQQAFVTYNSPDWIVKGADDEVRRFDGQDVDIVAAIVKNSALCTDLLQNLVEFIHDLSAKFPISATALALELCPQTLKDERGTM